MKILVSMSLYVAMEESGQYLGRFLKEENISFIAIDMDLKSC